MTAVLVFDQTGSQYPLSPDDVERMTQEYTITSTAQNGAQRAYRLAGEYPARIVANVGSESDTILQTAYRQHRKERIQKHDVHD